MLVRTLIRPCSLRLSPVPPCTLGPRPGKYVLDPTVWLSQASASLLLAPPPPRGGGRIGVSCAWGRLSLGGLWTIGGTLPDEGRGPRLGGTGPVPKWHSLRGAPAVSGRPSMGLAAWTLRRIGSASRFTGVLEVPAWGGEGGSALPGRPEAGRSPNSAGFRAPCRVGEGAMRRGRRFAG